MSISGRLSHPVAERTASSEGWAMAQKAFGNRCSGYTERLGRTGSERSMGSSEILFFFKFNLI